jgi:hypothetical protein
MKDFMDVCGAAERSLAKETVYTEELVETSAGSVLVAFSGDRYAVHLPVSVIPVSSVPDPHVFGNL